MSAQPTARVYGTPATYVDGLGGRSGEGCQANALASFLDLDISGEIDVIEGGRTYVVAQRAGFTGRLKRLDLYCTAVAGTLELAINGVTVATVLGVVGAGQFTDFDVPINAGDRITVEPDPNTMPAGPWAFSILARAIVRRGEL